MFDPYSALKTHHISLGKALILPLLTGTAFLLWGLLCPDFIGAHPALFAGAGCAALILSSGALPAGALLVRKGTKKGYVMRPDFMELDGSFYPGPGDVIAYPVRRADDCALAAEQVSLFCRGHKMDERKAFPAGLCVEELTTNVFRHGLRPGSAVKTLDLRVVADGEDVVIRLRDGGAAFSLKRFADRLSEEKDPNAGNGIRILLNAAKSINYYRTYGMNTTIIRV